VRAGDQIDAERRGAVPIRQRRAGPQRPTPGVAERFCEYRETGDRRLRNALVEQHLWMAKAAVRPYLGRGEPLDDLHQVALLGLVKAVERFDQGFGCRFAAFAMPTMQGELRRHFRDTTWALHAPRRLQELRTTVAAVVERLTHQLGRPPTAEEIAADADITVDDVLAAVEAGNAYRTRTLPGEAAEGPRAADRFVDRAAENRWRCAEHRMELEAMLERSTLSAKAKKVLYLRFFCDMTQSEIGQIVGISQVHVSRTLQASLSLLNRDGRGDDDVSVAPTPPV
jgi:RNA polymerase sigma-B factor